MPKESLPLRTTMLTAIVAAFAIGAPAADETKPAADPTKTVGLPPASPRAAVLDFLSLVRDGKDADAAEYLDTRAKNTQVLALQLAAVIEGQPRFDAERISASSDGDLDDDLPTNQEVVALIEGASGTPEQVRMIARDDGAPKWRFTESTVQRTPQWYEKTPNAWANRTLPRWLARRGPAGVAFWQWAALLLTVVVGWGFGTLAGRGMSRVLSKLVAKSKTKWDDLILAKLQGPLASGMGLIVGGAVVPFLGLPESTGSFLTKGLKGGFLIIFFWILLRIVDVVREALITTMLARDQPNSRSLVSLGSRFTKAMLFAVLVIAVLSLLGVPVGSLLAGLGIGGLAVALAGQKTLENLIGTFAIGFDRPFREGDFVKVRDFTATVETIGLRSTRFRTLDRTIITVPNGKLADEQIETYAARDRFRLFFTLGVRYDADPKKLESAVASIDAMVKATKTIDPTSVTVRVASLNDATMGVEVAAMLDTADGNEFTLARQKVLLAALEKLNEAGLTLDPASIFRAATSEQLAAAATRPDGAARTAAGKI